MQLGFRTTQLQHNYPGKYPHISKRGNGSLTEYVTEIDDKKLLFQLTEIFMPWSTATCSHATSVSVTYECICTISPSHGDI